MTMMSNQSSRLIPGDSEWVVFDAVGTLIQPQPSVAGAYQMIGSKYGSVLTTEEIGNRFRHAFRRSETETFGGAVSGGSAGFSSDAIERARWRWIVEEVLPDVRDIEQCFTELWDHFADPASWRCFDDVGPTLAALKASGHRLAIASNFDARLHSVCRGHSDLHFIDRCLVSSELGCRKPASDFYQRLITECGGDPNRIVMIGDDPIHDVAGPRAARMGAILIDRRTTQLPRDAICSLLQLV